MKEDRSQETGDRSQKDKVNRSRHSGFIPLSLCLLSPVSCLLSPVFLHPFILHPSSFILCHSIFLKPFNQSLPAGLGRFFIVLRSVICVEAVLGALVNDNFRWLVSILNGFFHLFN